MNTLKTKCLAVALALSASAAFAISYAPTISSVSMTQDNPSSREVTITYSLANGPAIVTVDIQTNATGDVWASIGAENQTRMTGDANVLVSKASGTILWRPDRSWPGHIVESGGARAVLTAYSPENPPDYMVVDLAQYAPARVKYYASTNALPGGLFADAYRTTHIVMRHIRAKGITWSMGSFMEEQRCSGYSSDVEKLHQVTMGGDYWIGVFELTQGQWAAVVGASPTPKFTGWLKRPMDAATYVMMREGEYNVYGAAAPSTSPDVPVEGSYLGQLRARTQIDFDLPTEAQWEFACRAGHGENEYGEGSTYKYTNWDASVFVPGRWKLNQQDSSISSPSPSVPPTNGTAECGSYPPNDWGIYDMHGNVWEYCRGRWQEDITQLNGEPAVTGTYAVRRGGSWIQSTTSYERSAARISEGITAQGTANGGANGFRVVCTGPIE